MCLFTVKYYLGNDRQYKNILIFHIISSSYNPQFNAPRISFKIILGIKISNLDPKIFVMTVDLQLQKTLFFFVADWWPPSEHRSKLETNITLPTI